MYSEVFAKGTDNIALRIKKCRFILRNISQSPFPFHNLCIWVTFIDEKRPKGSKFYISIVKNTCYYRYLGL